MARIQRQTDVSRVIEDNLTANGLAVIITNSYETCSRLEKLSGTRADGERMKESFQVLNFSTLHEHNLPKGPTMQLLYSVANYKKFPPSYRRVVFVFSGHGCAEHMLFTGEGQTVKVSDILSAFFPERAPLNGNLAKLFFIDAYRGKEANPGVIVPRSGREIQTLTIPKHGNFLVAYSTIPDHLSYEERAKGGIWISALADKLCRRDASVHDVLSEVNRELVNKYQKPSYAGFVQQPEFISRLNEPINLFREAQEATKILLPEIDSGDDDDAEEMGYVLVDPKVAITHNPPVPLQRPRSTSTGSTFQRVLQKAFRIGGKPRSSSFNETLLGSAHSPVSVTPPMLQARPTPKSPKEKLEQYCRDQGKPKPSYKVEKVNGKYRATVYVAKTCGRLTGDLVKTKWDAEMNASQLLLQKLGL